MTLLASEIPRPLVCALHRETKPPAAYPFSTLSHLSKIRRSYTRFPWLQSRIRPSRLPLPGPARQGRNVDVILPTSQCNQIFICRPARPAVSLSLAAGVVVGEAVYRRVIRACQTLCDENFSNSVFSSRGAFPRKAQGLGTPPGRPLPPSQRSLDGYTRVRAQGVVGEISGAPAG